MSDAADRKQQLVADRRRADRAPSDRDVVVQFEDLEIVGPGRNVSETGVYFVSDARARVRVLIDGRSHLAELIRVETLGNGRLGVAVRFVDED